MNLIFNLFTKKEILIVGLILCSLVLIVLVLTIWDIISKRRLENRELEEAFENMNKDEKINNEIEEKKENVLIPVETKKEEVLIEEIKTPEIKKETVINEEVLDTKKVVTPEPLIIDVPDDIQEIKVDSKKNALNELKQVEEELKNPVSLEETLTNIETLEEENAIISYHDLLEKTRELKIVEADSGNEPISISEVMTMFDNKEEVTMINEDSTEAYGGKSSGVPYVSPVSLSEVDTTKSLAEIQLENTANLEKLDKEIRKTNKFLSILNDLKKNLD